MARRYGDQSEKESDQGQDLGEEMADVLWVLLCLANQTGVNLTEAFEKGMMVYGPFGADGFFGSQGYKRYDAVLAMYHDQGQIAIKLLGFERGVTVAGGLPIPVATPAHGTAFDITGMNKANVSATRQAFDLLVSMANIHRTERDTT